MGSPEELGEALREIRKRRGMQQVEMARRAGITQAMASCYERGRRYPSLATLDALLVALDVDLDVLHRALRFVRHRHGRKGRVKQGGERQGRGRRRKQQAAGSGVGPPACCTGS